jgi:DNA-binding HxlR family transcriptional regulator
MSSYGQYCPISRSAEVLGDRWTIHIIRDFLTGASRFNELVRGNPGLSRALLSRRLKQLQAAGILRQADDGSYELTDAGRDLEPVVFGLATWGARWTFGEPSSDELDPDLLLWWLHRQLDANRITNQRFIVYVSFTDHRKKYWIVVEQDASLCLADPGFDVDVTLRADRAALYQTYLGRTSLADAVRNGIVQLDGSRTAVSAFVRAFGQSPVASIVEAEAAMT